MHRLLAFLLLSTVSARGMDIGCPQASSVCDVFTASEFVFVGDVLESEEVEVEVGGYRRTRQTTVFGVVKAWKGGPATQVVVWRGEPIETPPGRYLVLASRNRDGRLTPDVCSGLVPISRAEKEIRFIHELLETPANQILVTGEVRQLEYTEHDWTVKPRSKTLVKLTEVLDDDDLSSGRVWPLVTDADGLYRALLPRQMDSLRGEARVDGFHPAINWISLPEEHSPPRLCVETNFQLNPDRVVEIQLEGWDGLPIFERVGEGRSPASGPRPRMEWSAGTGRIESIPPGRYLLRANGGVRGTPEMIYPTYYFPGTEDRESAETLFFGVGWEDGVRTINWSSPPAGRAIRRVTVKGRVLDPDGQPAVGAPVSATLINQGDGFVPPQIGAVSDEAGHFEIEVIQGVETSVTASSQAGIERRETSSDPLEFVPQAQNATVVLQLKRMGRKQIEIIERMMKEPLY